MLWRSLFSIAGFVMVAAAPLDNAKASDITFISNGTQLSAAFFPASTTSHTTIVMLPGAGNGSFRNVSHEQIMIGRFRSVGLNVFVFDKPGVGQSKGTFNDGAPVSDMVIDAHAAIAYVRSAMPDATRRIGVFGVSRSAWTALEIAAQSLVDFDINVSPAVMQTMEQEIWAQGNFARTRYGLPDADVWELDQMQTIVWQYYASGVGRDAALCAWRVASGRPWFAKMKLSKQLPDRSALDKSFITYLQNNEYDVISAAERVTAPTLDVFGLKDGFVPAARSAGNLIAAFDKAKNTRSTFVLLPNTGHVMEVVNTQIECAECVMHGATIQQNPNYWREVSKWIVNTLKPN